MSEFEYFSAVVAVILALGVTHIVSQVSAFANAPATVRLHWLPITWLGIVLLSHLLAWWNIWTLREALSFSLPVFLYMLVGPTALYLAARLILPRLHDDTHVDLERHYFSTHRPFFAALCVFGLWPALLEMALPGPTDYVGVLQHSVLVVPLIACAVTARRPIHVTTSTLVALAFIAVLFS